MAIECDMNCLECKFDDCVNDETASELEIYINTKKQGLKWKNVNNISAKERKSFWYYANKKRLNKKSNEYSKKRTKERRKQGLCTKCGVKLSGEYNFVMCEECRKISREKQPKYNSTRLKYYYRNREKLSNNAKNIREYRKANGLCTKCAEKLPDGYKYITCESCRAKIRTANKKYKEKKRNDKSRNEKKSERVC